MPRIFLCHASEDKPQVREIYHRLKDLGFEPWLDEKDLLPGQDWDLLIETTLKTSDFVMVFLSERSVDKIGYVQREFRRARSRSEEMPQGYIYTIPVKLDDCEVPEQFSVYHWVNLKNEAAFDQVVQALRLGLEQRGETIIEPPPSGFQSTYTNCVGMEFVLIPAGTFTMGCPTSDEMAKPYEQPEHRVKISQPFYLTQVASY
ncbi:MAG: hypothetical protein ETSY1_43045, partial [Candidatus Entotheonella factor]